MIHTVSVPVCSGEVQDLRLMGAHSDRELSRMKVVLKQTQETQEKEVAALETKVCGNNNICLFYTDNFPIYLIICNFAVFVGV